MSITITKQEHGFLLESRAKVHRPREDVFDIFANAYNLEDLTPPTLRFEILTPDPIVMRAGLILDYRIRLRGIPFRWQSEIIVWEPPERFVDEQRSGPFLWWIHEHSFEADGGQTLVIDRVRYGVPGGAIVNTLFVVRDLRAIFDYRAKRLEALLRLNR
jgi:ligand-binding SRPBCC domain-containing protein